MGYSKYKISVLTEEQIRTLPTHRLLAYKNKLMGCRELGDDRFPEEVTKDKDIWVNIYNTVKDECSKREHLGP